MDNYILLWSFLVFISYLIYIVKQFGVLPSISDSYYFTKKRLLFAMFIFSVVWPITWLGQQSILMQLAGGVLSFVGVAAGFNDSKIEKFVHFTGAVLGFTFAFIAVGLMFGTWWLSFIMVAVVSLFNLIKLPNKTWWIEVVGFVLLMLGFLIK